MTWSAPIERTRSTFFVLHHAGHLGAERLGDLHGERAHAARRAVDEDLLPGLDLAVVAQELQGGGRRHADGGRLLEREVGRLRQEVVLARRRVLGECAGAPAEHLVARSKAAARSLPTASTVPAMSVPGTGFFGFRSPVAMRMTNGEPVIRIQSPTWMDAAWTRTRTSSSPISGLSMSRGSRTSAEPYLSWTIAFIASRLP